MSNLLLYLLATNLVAIFSGKNIAILPYCRNIAISPTNLVVLERQLDL